VKRVDADGRSGNETGLSLSVRVSRFRPCPAVRGSVRGSNSTHTRMALPSLIRPPRRTKSEDAMKQIAEAQRLSGAWDGCINSKSC